jgi:hypothetical protein
MSMDLETSLEMAAAAEAITLSSSDHAEGMAALRKKDVRNSRGTNARHEW